MYRESANPRGAGAEKCSALALALLALGLLALGFLTLALAHAFVATRRGVLRNVGFGVELPRVARLGERQVVRGLAHGHRDGRGFTLDLRLPTGGLANRRRDTTDRVGGDR